MDLCAGRLIRHRGRSSSTNRVVDLCAERLEIMGQYEFIVGNVAWLQVDVLRVVVFRVDG